MERRSSGTCRPQQKFHLPDTPTEQFGNEPSSSQSGCCSRIYDMLRNKVCTTSKVVFLHIKYSTYKVYTMSLGVHATVARGLKFQNSDSGQSKIYCSGIFILT